MSQSRSMRLILASRSPRRAQLLRDAGYDFEQVSPPYDDPPHPEGGRRRPIDVARHIAQAKARSMIDMLQQDRAKTKSDAPITIVMAADTLIVTPAGELAGTPTTRAQAAAMIASFLNDRHDVVSGVTVVRLNGDSDDRWTTFADVARVTIGAVSEQAVDDYLDQNAWQGKAGGYNLFDRQDAGWPITVEGDPTTVVGLPMGPLIAVLDRFGAPRHPPAGVIDGSANLASKPVVGRNHAR